MSAVVPDNRRVTDEPQPASPAEVNAARMAARRDAMSLDTLGPMPSRVIPHALRARLIRLAPPAPRRPDSCLED